MPHNRLKNRSQAGRMPRFAKRVTRALRSHSAYPTRIRDRSLIGDLAELEWRTHLLKQALLDFVATNPPRGPASSFEKRLLRLAGQVRAISDVCRDLKGPMRRLLESKVGEGAEALALLEGAESTLQGFQND